MDERELLLKYRQQGDVAVLGKLYAPYMSLLYGVCYKYLANAEQSQDAVMQIFEELVSKLRIHQVEHFKSWLYSYTRNYCLMELRRNKNKHQLSIDAFQEETGSLSNADELRQWEEQDFERMDACLYELNEEQGKCIRLFYLAEKCYKEIAAETGYEISKVKSYIQNGKRNLKICMERNKHGK